MPKKSTPILIAVMNDENTNVSLNDYFLFNSTFMICSFIQNTQLCKIDYVNYVR